MFTIQNPAALRILVDLSCFVLGNLFPLDLLKEKVLVFRETPTHCSVAYIHDPLLWVIVCNLVCFLVLISSKFMRKWRIASENRTFVKISVDQLGLTQLVFC
jgi:hypothetical protein